jgi:heme exporter protein A
MEQVVARGVTRTFGATAALRGVDATFDRGEITTLEGHNGSGKSTLLAIIGTLLAPTSGSILYDGSHLNAGIRKEIGWLSHEAHCYPDLTAEQNVRFAASLYGVEAGEGWRRSSDRFAIDSFARVPLRQLSRGQRQRVALARAVVHQPSLLLLDEPTTGLDADGTERLLKAVGEEAGRGCIVIFVTHDPIVAERVATRRLYLQQGRLRAPPAAAAPGSA